MECEVLKVTKADETCEVRHLDTGMEFTDVQLRAFEAGKPGLGLVLFPKPGCLATVALVDLYSTSAFMVNCGEIESIVLKMNGFELKVHANGTVEANRGDKGGLVISEKVANEINELKQDLNELKALLAALATTGTGLGGAPLPGSAVGPFANYAAQLFAPTLKNELENPKIKHG
jgi:hypothetical protein